MAVVVPGRRTRTAPPRINATTAIRTSSRYWSISRCVPSPQSRRPRRRGHRRGDRASEYRGRRRDPTGSLPDCSALRVRGRRPARRTHGQGAPWRLREPLPISGLRRGDRLTGGLIACEIRRPLALSERASKKDINYPLCRPTIPEFWTPGPARTPRRGPTLRRLCPGRCPLPDSCPRKR